MRKMVFGSLVLFFGFNAAKAQEYSAAKYGQIKAADFQISAPALDSGASAVIIADIGKTAFEGNKNGFFSIVYTRYMRVKILNRNGFDVANNRIHTFDYHDGRAALLTDIKGVTYNLENGLVKETKLDPTAIYDEKLSKYRQVKKFTMPALKEGSEFDLIYTLKSTSYSDPPDWAFQSAYPCLWSEYEVTIPTVFHYFLKSKGDNHYDISTSKAVEQSFSIQKNRGSMQIDEVLHVTGTSLRNRWVKKNVPAIREQPYVSSVENYKSSIYFELDYFQQDAESEKSMQMKTWNEECRALLQKDDFGEDLNQVNSWMDDDLKEVTRGLASPEEEMKRIFQFVRDNFKCTDETALYVNTSLKDVFKNRAGNVAELNLLLVALLRHRGVTADPAILSTRDNGMATIKIPLLYEYNYVICVARSGDRVLYLDASRPYNGFNKLPSYCRNWYARLVNETRPDVLYLTPDSVTESKVTQVLITNDDDGRFSGHLNTIYGADDSYDIRDAVRKNSAGAYIKKIKTAYTDADISDITFDSLNKPEFPLSIGSMLDFRDVKDAKLIYFNAMLGSGIEKNPFESAERLYPVEIPYKMDYTYLMSMEVPKGFQVDELPKSARVKFNDDQGMFEYLVQLNAESVQMRVNLRMNKATFATDEYGSLRDFFAFVVKKENEQIVFKRKE